MPILLDNDSFVLAFRKCVSEHVIASLRTLRAPHSIVPSTKKAYLHASHPLHVLRRCKVLKRRQVGTKMLWICDTHFRKMAYEVGMYAVEEVSEIIMCCIIKVRMAPAATERHVKSVAHD
jgi:ribosomal protein S14